MEELAHGLQGLETQVGQQCGVIEHQQEQLMHQQTTMQTEQHELQLLQLPGTPE